MHDGYFAPDSMLRRIHGERAVGLLYGQRALAIGALNPLNFVGTHEHTHSRLTPFRRLAHTARWFEIVFFGSRAQADQVLGAVARMHARVEGVLPADAGAWPKGSPYAALDPPLMLWTVAVAADSAMHFYTTLVRAPSDSQRERFWQDYIRFGELFGMPRAAAPASWAELQEYMRTAIERGHLTAQARRTGRAVAFEIPMPGHAQPAKRVHDLLLLGSLPQHVRELYGLPWTPAHQRACEAARLVARRLRVLTPGPLARGRCERFFDVVEQTERRRLRRGEPTPQLL
ncbi:MAG: hypothetical protein NVSMB51_10210 [Solirubrobacteraceae bacterium]